MLVSNHTAQPSARFMDYVAIGRPDHWIKHVLIVPGVGPHSRSTRGRAW
jgi:hypothetical protein